MVSFTPVNGWPLYESEDDMDITQAVAELASEVDDDLLPVMTTATRDATISPSEGMLSYVTDRQAVEIYDGLIWREADKTRLGGSKDVILQNTSAVAIPGLTYRANAGGTYHFDGVLQHHSDADDDIVFQWTVPSNTDGRWITASGGSPSTAIGSSRTINIPVDDFYITHFLGWFRVTETGNVTLTVRRNSNTGTGIIRWRSIAFNFTRVL